ncbi:hypothetical protein DSO57_1006282 [Entomophthora muscae]|uniref:Uncharacterized protein n=1 Tax=Entomophthora muscae TaxID=34485 RepID=A0ACC2SKP5_9FUNG|nr:hypothetical protein DSO57_1006282 [Entomophthora muscae]
MRRAINRHCSSDCLSTLAYTVSILAYLVAIGIVPNLQATCQDHPRFQVPMKLKPVSITSNLLEPNTCLECKRKVYHFNDQITLNNTSLNPQFCLYSLLLGYFKFMSDEFDLTTSAIDLPLGPIIPRSLRDTGNQTMWIGDPFHPNRNLASNLTSSATIGTLWEMSRASTILRQHPDPEKLFLPYRPIPDQLFIDMEIYPTQSSPTHPSPH